MSNEQRAMSSREVRELTKGALGVALLLHGRTEAADDPGDFFGLPEECGRFILRNVSHFAGDVELGAELRARPFRG
jgi:hypothetical protein